jgi:membrane-associated protease RseP (regulator of RpoE activity)
MSYSPAEQDVFTPLVREILDIEQVTWGSRELQFVVRYRGQLKIDSMAAYAQLADGLKGREFTPLFREEEGLHSIVIVEGLMRDGRVNNPLVNLGLFVLTIFSVLFAGALFSYDGPVADGVLGPFITVFLNLDEGIPFGLSILAILLAHEFGHYIAARIHNTAVTLPYFIPFPLSPFGTMGAFIQLKEPPRNKRVLHDIGIAGPLAGLAVTIPLLIWGISLSPVEVIPLFIDAGQGFYLEGNSLLYLFAKYIVHGELLPAPRFSPDNPLFFWVRYVLTGLPTPLGGRDISLHPIAWAGWAGLLVTGLNLIPAGQLDGGHILYVLFGKHANKALPVILVTLGLLGFAWGGWWLWVLMIYFLGRKHAEPLDQITELDSMRTTFAILTLILFLLIFIPVPLRVLSGPYLGP